MKIIVCIILCALVAAGCAKRKLSRSDFQFITTNTTQAEVIQRLGKEDRIRGSGIAYFQYNLSDGSVALLAYDPDGKGAEVAFRSSPDEIKLP